VDGFLDAEQALLLGHLRHPAPKSRDGIRDAELAAWAPELRAATPLHWFAVRSDLLRHDAVAGSPALGGDDAPGLLARLAGFDDGYTAGRLRGMHLVPAHPWQAADLPRRPAVAALIEAGAVRPLGPHGPAWWPTSSWRTLYHPDAPVMLKLSLGLRLTNCVRESSRRELRRGPAVHRLLDAGIGAATAAAHPGFTVLRDPAWLALQAPDGRLTGLDVSVREVPPGITSLRCLAGLLAPRPGIGPSPLATLPAACRDPRAWLARYAARVLVPMLHFYSSTGIGLEGHQQNTLVRLGADGSVTGGAFRDNQGFYLVRSELDTVRCVLGEEAVALDPLEDDTLDDWQCYYLLHNQALSVVGALGEAGLAAERPLLAVLREVLDGALPGLDAAGPHGGRLVRRWLSAATLPAKANLLTRLHGIDEVTAPMSDQAVYLDVPNPLVAR
jgi:siderophore synthetase component